MTHEMTMKAEALLDAMEQMRMYDKMFTDLCTGKCAKCPMHKECLGDGSMDVGYEYTIEKMADYIDYYDKVEQEQVDEQREAEIEALLIDAWESANRWAGVDPNWAKIRR